MGETGLKAYAILAGGGAKGAALAGCLEAAEEVGIEFVGYGGTSAGSIIALLACVGYTPEELHEIMLQTNFADFLDDGGEALDSLKRFPSEYRAARFKLAVAWKYLPLLKRIGKGLGLYDASKLQDFLLTKVKHKLPALTHCSDISFNDLHTNKCPPLKVLVTDLGVREPRIYSNAGGDDNNGSVIDAVRASASYPIVFKPVKMGQRYLVDGGLSSNLPVFLFEDERKRNGLSVFAFDLMVAPGTRQGEYSLDQYCADMVVTCTPETGQFPKRVLANRVAGATRSQDETEAIQ